MPELAQRCIYSWRKHMEDCEIKCWDENNFDVYAIPYTTQAYRLGKYAFVSDYARLWILYHHGGIYLDTDVELLRPLDDLMEDGAFMGQEQVEQGSTSPMHCAMGLGMACEPHHPFIGKMLRHYRLMHFVTRLGRQADTIVDITNRLLADEPVEEMDGGVLRCAGFNIYSWPYLCPLNYFTGELTLCEQTHAIHHYAASWVDDLDRETLVQKLCRRLRAAYVRNSSLWQSGRKRGGRE